MIWYKIKSKQIAKIENRTIKKNRTHLVHLLGGPTGPAQLGPVHLFLSPTVFNLPPVGRRACGRGARARARPAPACR